MIFYRHATICGSLSFLLLALGGAMQERSFAQNTFPSTGPVGIGTATPRNGSALEIDSAPGGSGTISVTGGSGTVTGTGTSFLETYASGDQIIANGETHTVSAIASDTSMTTDNWTNTFSGGYASSYPVDGALKWSFLQNGRLLFGNWTPGGGRMYLSIQGTWNSPGTTQFVRINPVLNSASGNVVGLSATPQINATTASYAGQVNSLVGAISVGLSNTQNWTRTDQFQPAGIVGAFSSLSPGANPGGTVTNGNAGLFYFNLTNPGVTITNGYLIHGYGNPGPAKPVNAVGLALNSFTGSSNTSYLLMGTDTPPAGQYAIYDQTGLADYFSGNVGIGVKSPVYPLSVKGTIGAGEVVVTNTNGWSDYVFDADYPLASLGDTAVYIHENHHLPGIPSAADVAKDGINLAEMQSKLLAKIEELTLHMIQAEERDARLEQENQKLRRGISSLEAVREH